MDNAQRECRSAWGGAADVLRVSLPLVAAALLTALNGFTDNLFLARHSETALRAALPANVFAGFVTMLALVTIGYCGTMLARALGSRRPAHAVSIAANGILLSLASSVLFAAVRCSPSAQGSRRISCATGCRCADRRSSATAPSSRSSR